MLRALLGLALPFLLGLCTGLAAEKGPAAPAPAPGQQNLLATLRKGHPRLLAGPADFDALKTRIAAKGPAAAWSESLLKRANALLSEPPNQYVIPDGKRLLATSRSVLDRTLALGLAFRLTGDARFSARLWQELDAAARFKDWNPGHFLDTAEMTAGFAIGYDWLYAEWSPQQRDRLREAIVKMGLTPSLEYYRGQKWWVTAEHNWNQVCNGGMVLGALAVAEEEPALANEILRGARQSVPRAMRHFAPDGAWGEGPGYWNYAVMFNVFLLAGIEGALGTDWGLSKMEGFSRTGEFPMHMSGPLGRTFNFADGGDGPTGGPHLFWLASRFNQEGFAAWRLATLGASPAPLDLLWGAAWLERKPTLAAQPAARHFREVETVLMRSAWADPKATFVGFKAGDNKFNHSHLDLGSFVLDAAGQRWALDPGKDDYNLPGYFGPLRWTYYRLRAEGHNTLVLAPGSGPDQDPNAAAKITRFSDRPGASFAIADLGPAYAQSARAVLRGIALRGRDMLVQDEVRADKPVELWWFMHTRAEMKCDGAKAILTQGGEQLTATILSPPGATFESLPAEPLPASPHPPKQQQKGQGKDAPARKLAIHLPAVTDLRLVILLSPGKEPASAPAVVPLADWK